MTEQAGGAVDPRVLDAAVHLLDPRVEVITPAPALASALADRGRQVTVADITQLPPGSSSAVALVADELSAAGEHGEGLIAATVAALRPGGAILVSAVGEVHQRLHGGPPGRAYRATDVQRALGHHGVDIDVLCAPGAAGIVAGTAHPAFDSELDRLPGLLDVAPRIVAAGRTATSAAARSRSFFATLPYKVVAAAVVCRDEHDRLLVVHDSFKGHWTIPGGVVDAEEDPRAAAEREAWEEAGVRVTAGPVLGVFSAAWPDRVVLVYAATPLAGADHPHRPLHAHEIDAVDWWPVDEALQRLSPHVAEQVQHCLTNPGGTLRQRRA
jgi:ADP-ribose pyrophosphatase YjhB (NUDIX family)